MSLDESSVAGQLCPENRRPTPFESVTAADSTPIQARIPNARRQPPDGGMCVSCDPVNFWMEKQRRERPALPGHRSKALLGCVVQKIKSLQGALSKK